MFYGRKDQYYLLWPVRGHGNGVLPRTGQQRAYAENGAPMEAVGTGQDGELQIGAAWPTPRYSDRGDYVIDRLTNLCWTKEADLSRTPWTGKGH